MGKRIARGYHSKYILYVQQQFKQFFKRRTYERSLARTFLLNFIISPANTFVSLFLERGSIYYFLRMHSWAEDTSINLGPSFYNESSCKVFPRGISRSLLYPTTVIQTEFSIRVVKIQPAVHTQKEANSITATSNNREFIAARNRWSRYFHFY